MVFSTYIPNCRANVYNYLWNFQMHFTELHVKFLVGIPFGKILSPPLATMPLCIDGA